MKSCFFIGHREASSEVLPALTEAIEQHIVEYGVTKFIVGNYGGFDYMAAKAVIAAKERHPGITLSLLIPYHPAERPIKPPPGFDNTFYPPGMEKVPRKLAIVRANRYMVDHVDYLISYAWHPASNARDLVEYYQFTSKVAVEIPQKRSALQRVCLIGGIAAVIVTLATIIIDGFSSVNFLTGVFVPVFLLISAFRKNTKIDYVPTLVSISLDSNKVIICYPSVKYHIDEAPVSEIYEFSSESIRQFQFSAALSAVRFYGMPVISINDKKQIDNGKMREKVVYLPPDDAESICVEIERFLGINAERKEN